MPSKTDDDDNKQGSIIALAVIAAIAAAVALVFLILYLRYVIVTCILKLNSFNR